MNYIHICPTLYNVIQRKYGHQYNSFEICTCIFYNVPDVLNKLVNLFTFEQSVLKDGTVGTSDETLHWG